MSEPRFADQEFRTLLDLWMVSDPWPLKDADDNLFMEMLRKESRIRGYDDEVVAYHEFMRKGKP